MNLKIGDLTLKNPFLLAPLAGITDQAMRSLCYQAGASLTYTEMVSAKGLWYGDRKTSELLAIGDEEGPVAYQLFGSEPAVLAHAVYALSEVEHIPDARAVPGPPPKPWPGYKDGRRPVLFDLNAGCPVPKIVKNGEGSALLKDPDLLYDCVSAMVDASRDAAGCKADTTTSPNPAGRKDGADESCHLLPVTVKIRKGFARGEDLSLENAKAIEAAGASAITVHGRCREQYYDGEADWECIARVKDALHIPVIGNGDVMCGADAIRMMEETGCDGVMIARGALGNPWIFAEACSLYDRSRHDGTSDGEGQENSSISPTGEERVAVILKHIDLVCKYKGEYTCVREMRKHIGWYVKGLHGATEIRRRVNEIKDVDRLKQLLIEYSAQF